MADMLLESVKEEPGEHGSLAGVEAVQTVQVRHDPLGGVVVEGWGEHSLH